MLDTTVLEWEPYWKITTEGNITTYNGMDYELLEAMGEVLNFTFRILPSTSWDDVRLSMMIQISYLNIFEGLCIRYWDVHRGVT